MTDVEDDVDRYDRSEKGRNVFAHRERVHPELGDFSMTRQEFAAECDINTLMAKYERVGGAFPAPDAVPRYLDLSGTPDFQTAMNLMIEADRAFMTLPAKVRREFDNDPAEFVRFAEDSANLDRMREWGLAPPAPVSDAVSEAKPPVEPSDAK